MTHPTRADIQKAIDDKYYIEQPFSGGGTEEKLMNEWMAQAGLDPAKLLAYIEIATRWHAGRIEALEFREETEVEVVVCLS